MLAGRAVIAIWNGITPDARARFTAWHDNEHVPERVAIPGFLRGRRYAAADHATAPAFFTLYEVADFAVIEGRGYRERLDHPTKETERVTARFRDTVRALARVAESYGAGVGGVLLTVRFPVGLDASDPTRRLVREAAHAPGVTGAHLCVTDLGASGIRSAESRGRSDIGEPPGGFVLLEGHDAESLAPFAASLAHEARNPSRAGLYRLEYLREKMVRAADG